MEAAQGESWAALGIQKLQPFPADKENLPGGGHCQMAPSLALLISHSTHSFACIRDFLGKVNFLLRYLRFLASDGIFFCLIYLFSFALRFRVVRAEPAAAKGQVRRRLAAPRPSASAASAALQPHLG